MSDDLPTPPLPEATAITRVVGVELDRPVDSGRRRGASSSAPRARRALMTSNSSRTVRHARQTRRRLARPAPGSELRSGQPATVSAIVTDTSPPSIVDVADHVELGDRACAAPGRSRSPSAARIASCVGTDPGYPPSRAAPPTGGRQSSSFRAARDARAGRRGRAAPTPNGGAVGQRRSRSPRSRTSSCAAAMSTERAALRRHDRRRCGRRRGGRA